MPVWTCFFPFDCAPRPDPGHRRAMMRLGMLRHAFGRASVWRSVIVYVRYCFTNQRQGEMHRRALYGRFGCEDPGFETGVRGRMRLPGGWRTLWPALGLWILRFVQNDRSPTLFWFGSTIYSSDCIISMPKHIILDVIQKNSWLIWEKEKYIQENRIDSLLDPMTALLY